MSPRRAAYSAGSRVGEEWDVGPAGWSERIVEQRHDKPTDIAGREPGAQRRVGAPEHLGIDGARTDADGADPVSSALDGNRLGEADNPVLRDVVGGKAREL